MDDPRKYIQIASDVRKMIKAGDLKPGDPTPPITEWAKQLGVARQTASKGLNILVLEGLLVRYPGLGYFVNDADG